MDSKQILALTILISILMLLVQRTEATKRRLVMTIMLLPALVIGFWVHVGGYLGELIVGLFLALLVNFLFWVLVGRYNPVASSDQIRVLRLDD